ncbi:MAG: hypothetical protein DYG98_16875 [Haliscomenobacteraceae bacterium CHB4]|nr:hypothetical protein [Haliscomenobacteraceae bacterium CHB4]
MDCAIAAKADFIVTDDRHFNVLNNIAFPKVKVVSSVRVILCATTSSRSRRD